MEGELDGGPPASLRAPRRVRLLICRHSSLWHIGNFATGSCVHRKDQEMPASLWSFRFIYPLVCSGFHGSVSSSSMNNTMAKCASTLENLLDLDQQFLFYHSYHNNFINQVIHVVCVWPILWSALVLLHHSSPFCRTPSFLPQSIVINLAFVSTLLYMAFYIALEVKNHESLSGIGYLAAAMALASYVTAGVVRRRKYISVVGIKAPVSAWNFATALNVSCWVAQFVGHGVFEGRAPALLDNLLQAFFMAPLFVIVEGGTLR